MAKLYIPPLHPLIDAITLPVEEELPQTTLRKVIENRVNRGGSRALLEAVFDVCFSPSPSLVDMKKTALKKWLEEKTGESLKTNLYTDSGKYQYTMSIGGRTVWRNSSKDSDKNKEWVKSFLLLVRKIGND